MFFKMRVRASSSLITTDLINWQSRIGNSDENREHATKVGVGNQEFPAIFSLCIW